MSKARHACDVPPKVGAVIELDTKYGKCTGTVKDVSTRPNCWVANVIPTEPRPDRMDPKAEWMLESAEGHRWNYIEGAPTVADVIPGEVLPPEPEGIAESSAVKGRKRKFDWNVAFALFEAGKTAAEVAKELGCTAVNAYAIKKKWSASKSGNEPTIAMIAETMNPEATSLETSAPEIAVPETPADGTTEAVAP